MTKQYQYPRHCSAFLQFPTIACILLTINYELLTIDYELSTIDYGLSSHNHRLLTTGY